MRQFYTKKPRFAVMKVGAFSKKSVVMVADVNQRDLVIFDNEINHNSIFHID